MATKSIMFMQTPDFKKMLSDIDTLSTTGIDEAVRSALIECHKYITPILDAAMQKHIKTGITAASLDVTPKVYVNGFVYSIEIGYHVSQGGLPAIFLIRGTPKMTPDKELYDAVYGRTTTNKIYEIQTNALKAVLKKYMEG